MATTSSTPTAFTGSSAFSSDLQQVITRAVNIASLPIAQLQTQISTLNKQQTELQTLGAKFQTLQSALDAINSASDANSFSANVDNQSVATATVGSQAQAGSYSIQISSIGSQTNTLSSNTLTTVTDPSSGNISSSSDYTLTVDGQTFTVAATSLNGLAQAINASGAGVQATIVNVGGSTAPDYRLSLQGSKYAPTTIQLNDGSQDLLNTLSTGANVTYEVAGSGTTATSDSRTFSISPGVTVHAITTGAVNITVAQNVGGIQNAITSFVNSYNSAVDELQENRGQNGGALAGQSIVSELGSALRTLAGYTPTSNPSIQSIADLGLTFDQNGHLQFDSSVFNDASDNSLSDVLNFLGSETSGGFLQAANNILDGITDSSDGLVATDITSLSASAANLTKKISSEQDTVNTLQTNLIQQMSKADAAISQMEQQVTQITNLFAAMQQASRTINGN